MQKKNVVPSDKVQNPIIAYFKHKPYKSHENGRKEGENFSTLQPNTASCQLKLVKQYQYRQQIDHNLFMFACQTTVPPRCTHIYATKLGVVRQSRPVPVQFWIVASKSERPLFFSSCQRAGGCTCHKAQEPHTCTTRTAHTRHNIPKTKHRSIRPHHMCTKRQGDLFLQLCQAGTGSQSVSLGYAGEKIGSRAGTSHVPITWKV